MESSLEEVPAEVLGYAAGFIDGEGCISISKNGAADVRVVNTAKHVLVYLQKYFGGSITTRTQRVNKTQYAYSLYGQEAIDFLNKIVPYLIDKKPQAETLIEYFGLRNELNTFSKPGHKGRFANPDREILVSVFRDILTEQKREEH
jgi:hypothetical protein